MNTSTKTDYEAVKQTILDYVEGVYEANFTLIERSVHPDLTKRGFFVNEKGASESIMPFTQFIEHTKTYNKDGQFPSDAPKEVIIYEILDHTASAKLIAAWGIDYMHLAKYNDTWMIVHVLWQTHPQNEAEHDRFLKDRVYGNYDAIVAVTILDYLFERGEARRRSYHKRSKTRGLRVHRSFHRP